MAAYPDFGQVVAGGEDVVDEVLVDRASNGTVNLRGIAPARRAWRIQHLEPAASVATHQAFYAANRLVSFDFTWARDGVTYSAVFASRPRYTPVGGTEWRIDVVLESAG